MNRNPCATCRHWQLFRDHGAAVPDEPRTLGTCTRYPPTLDHNVALEHNVMSSDSTLPWLQPVTGGHDTCAEHAPRAMLNISGAQAVALVLLVSAIAIALAYLTVSKRCGHAGGTLQLQGGKFECVSSTTKPQPAPKLNV